MVVAAAVLNGTTSMLVYIVTESLESVVDFVDFVDKDYKDYKVLHSSASVSTSPTCSHL